MLKTIGGILAGIVVALATIAIIDLANHQIFPRPEGLDLRDREAVSTAIMATPAAGLGLVVFAWFAGALTGGAIAGLVTGLRWTAWLVAGVVAASSVANILMFPHPDWMQVLAVIAPALGGVVAGHFAGRRAVRRVETGPDEEV
jgi:hypothetical protein